MRRRLDPLTAVLILACCGLTVYYLVGKVPAPKAGALSQLLYWRGDYWRVLTATLLHGNWTHLIVNCLSLYFVGTVVAEGLGRPVYLGSVVLGALGGFAASLLTTMPPHPNPEYRVGISGAIAGLVGLILAVEWRNSKGIGDFLRQRNTILIMIFVTLSVGLGIWIERKNPGVRIDHAAHIGGAVACCAAGLFYYGRSRFHPVRGIVAVLVIGVLPVAYAAYPYWDSYFCIFKAERSEGEVAGAWYERAYDLDPGNPTAAAYAAIRRDDPELLKGTRLPAIKEIPLIVHAHLTLAYNRLENAPDEAMALVRVASLMRPAPYTFWWAFHGKASGAGRTGISEIAARMTLLLAESQKAKELWRFALPLWAVADAQVRAALVDEDADKLGIALDAAYILYVISTRLETDERLDEHTSNGIEKGLVRSLNRVEILERTAEVDATRLLELRTWLRETWLNLAENGYDQKRNAEHLFKSGYWWGLSIQGTDEETTKLPDVAYRIERALREARSYQVPKVERLATLWFKARDLPVPAGDLADIGEDG